MVFHFVKRVKTDNITVKAFKELNIKLLIFELFSTVWAILFCIEKIE